MDIAIVTGAETPLGLRIIEGLIQQGCRVHGIGNNLSHITFADRNFIAHAIDVSDLDAVQKTTNTILEKEGALHILIHAIDVTPGGNFEKLPVGNLEAILKIGLLGPVMLTRLALPNLLRFRGQLINIIPANKSGNKASAVNALVEGGLREMNTALFDQARDAGLRITNLILCQNTALPAADVNDEQLEQTRIDPDQVARTVDFLLNANESNVPNEVTLHPRLSPAADKALPETPLPVDPYNAIVLPPAKYCPPEEPKIKTREPEHIERTIPYTDEEMEEKIAAAIEDFEVHPERYEPQQRKQRPEKQPRKEADKQNQSHNPQDDESTNSKRRRGRRRGGRNRNRDRDQNNDQATSNDAPQHNAGDKTAHTGTHNQESTNQSDKPNRNRRRRGRKPDQAISSDNRSSSESSKHATESTPKPTQNKPNKRVSRSKSSENTPAYKSKKQASKPKKAEAPKSTTEAKPTTKKAVKKIATKKAVKKVATKKTATKKAVKKSATKKVPAKKAAKKATKKAVKKKVIKKAE